MRTTPHAGPELETIERLYDREYFLSDCDGHREFQRTHGGKLPRRLKKCLLHLGARPGELIVDVGSGRGELALHLARIGALALAVDPSPAAGFLAAELRERNSRSVRARLMPLLARGEMLPLAPSRADAVVLSDVVEHLLPADLERLLRECFRVLKKGGRLVVHTQPNRLLLDWTVPVLSRFSRLWGVRLPRDLRTEMTPGASRKFHVNEQTRRNLTRVLRGAGFVIDELWLEGSYPLHRIFGEAAFKPLLLRVFRRRNLLKELFASQIFARAHRPR